MAKFETIGAKVEREWGWPEHLDTLARKWSEESGQAVTRSDVVRALLKAGLDAHPVDEADRQRAKAAGPRRAPQTQTLQVLRLDGAQAVGFEPVCSPAAASAEASEEEERPQGDLTTLRQIRPPVRRDRFSAPVQGMTSQYSRRVTRRAA